MDFNAMQRVRCILILPSAGMLAVHVDAICIIKNVLMQTLSVVIEAVE